MSVVVDPPIRSYLTPLSTLWLLKQIVNITPQCLGDLPKRFDGRILCSAFQACQRGLADAKFAREGFLGSVSPQGAEIVSKAFR